MKNKFDCIPNGLYPNGLYPVEITKIEICKLKREFYSSVEFTILSGKYEGRKICDLIKLTPTHKTDHKKIDKLDKICNGQVLNSKLIISIVEEEYQHREKMPTAVKKIESFFSKKVEPSFLRSIINDYLPNN